MRDLIEYIVAAQQGWYIDTDRWTNNPQNASVFSRRGAIALAVKLDGTAYSINIRTEKIRKVTR